MCRWLIINQLWHLTDKQLLTNFNLNYPQNLPWKHCTLQPEMNFTLLYLYIYMYISLINLLTIFSHSYHWIFLHHSHVIKWNNMDMWGSLVNILFACILAQLCSAEVFQAGAGTTVNSSDSTYKLITFWYRRNCPREKLSLSVIKLLKWTHIIKGYF